MGRRKAAIAAAGVALTLALTSCAGSRVANENQDSGQGSSSGGMIAQLTFPAEVDASIGGLVNYNPYAPKQLTKTWLYEPLMMLNSLDCKVTPWLATGYKWESPKQARLRHPSGREVVGRLGLHGGRCRLHLQPDEEVPGDRPGRDLERRRSARKATSVVAEGNQVIFDLRRRRGAEVRRRSSQQPIMSRARIRRGRRPDEVRRQEPGLHRAVRGRQLQRPPSRAGPPRRLLAGRQDQGREARPGGELRRQRGRAQAAQRRPRLLHRRDTEPAEDRSSSADPQTTTSGTPPNGTTVVTPEPDREAVRRREVPRGAGVRHRQAAARPSRRPTG